MMQRLLHVCIGSRAAHPTHQIGLLSLILGLSTHTRTHTHTEADLSFSSLCCLRSLPLSPSLIHTPPTFSSPPSHLSLPHPSPAALGQLYWEGLGCKRKEEEGLEWLRRAAARGNTYGTGLLSLCYFQKKLFGKAIQQAKR